MAGEPKRDHAFYVGYLPLPRAHAVFLLIAVPLSIAGMVVGALGLARDQPAWGGGVWQTDLVNEWRGTLRLEPYPMLHVKADDGGIETYLLVEMGKFGTRDRFAGAEGLDGAAVKIRGRRLHRDGRKMIELDPDDPKDPKHGPAVALLEEPTPAVWAPMTAPGPAVTLRGEIVDSKCYLGAMKPGTGRGHKACATLCISGGIPPVLVSRDADGKPEFALLADNAGAGLSDSDLAAIKPVIGEPVVLSGRPARVGSWRVLLLDRLDAQIGGVSSAVP